MATLTISLSGSSVVNGSKNYTVADDQVTRLINAMKHYYGNSNTNAQLLVAWADGLIDYTKTKVVQAEKDIATSDPLVIT